MEQYRIYPRELLEAELEALELRRQAAGTGMPKTVPPGKLPCDTLGLALSGGGIRSATFCLGFLQGLAERKYLRRVDFLSTVSGGGYVGGFIGRFYDRLRGSTAPPCAVIEAALTDPRSPEIEWLRSHGEFIAPAGKKDLLPSFAIFLRNFLTVHFVLGLFVFSLFGLANVLRYGLLQPLNALLPFAGFGWQDMPIGHFVVRGFGVFWSPWFVLVELAILLFALPYALGYWLASQDRSEAYTGPGLAVVFITLAVVLVAGVADGLKLYILMWALPLLCSFVAVEDAWYKVRQDNKAVGTGGPSVEHMRARSHLTRDLGTWLGISCGLLAFAVLDTIGHALFERARGTSSYVAIFARLGAALAMLLPLLRGAAQWIANYQSKRPNPGSLVKLLSTPAASAVIAPLLLAPPLIIVSYAAHATFGGGDHLAIGIGATLFTLVLSVVLALPAAMLVVNRSSLHGSYSVRLARAFLGASNPLRAGDVNDDVMPGDDVEAMPLYRPHEAGGPIHLINVCVNETVEISTETSSRRRKGTNVSVSPISISVGLLWHAIWNRRRAERDAGARSRRAARHPRLSAAAQTKPHNGWDDRRNQDEPKTTYDSPRKDREADTSTALWVVGHPAGLPHPLLAADRLPADRFEVLPLREWISISGAAFGPGMGRGTSSALAVLMTLANLRIGYWWDSGLSAQDRGSRPDVFFVRRLLFLLPSLFNTQARLVDEAQARFHGPWERHWYLSDGGGFENLAAYELIRRRVPYIIMLDSGADPRYQFDDFANFQRLIRIDFRVELEAFGKDRWEAEVDRILGDRSAEQAARAPWNALRKEIALGSGEGGPFDELITADGRRGKHFLRKHAALFRVVYPDGARSLILYVKASLDGKEPADIHQYHIDHPEFPHESTADQFFDEAQWECYRCLGQHVANDVLGSAPGSPFWLLQLSTK